MTDMDRLDALAKARHQFEIIERAIEQGGDIYTECAIGINAVDAAVRERDELRAALEVAGYRFDSIGEHLKPDATDEDREQVAIDWWFGSEEVRAALHREAGA